MKKMGFTLAEVLITLGIIGVVAAMTIPNLQSTFQKRKVETSLRKFYATINQAIRLSINDNGDPEGWIEYGRDYNANETLAFLEHYILPYLKHSNVKACASINTGGAICVDLQDGSRFSLQVDYNGGDVVYWINPYLKGTQLSSPRNKFYFQFYKRRNHQSHNLDQKSKSSFEPYMFLWDGKPESLRNGQSWSCNSRTSAKLYCTKMIEQNNWKIPNDYPW